MPGRSQKLGEMLINAGIIDAFQLSSALSHQRNHGGRLGGSLIKLGYISEERLLNFLAEQYNTPRVDPVHRKVVASVLAMLPAEKARQFYVMPLEQSETTAGKALVVAMTDPTNLTVIDSLQFITGLRIRPVLASERQLKKAINKFYGPDPLAREEWDDDESPLITPQPKPASAAGQPPTPDPAAETSPPQISGTEERLQALLGKLLELGILNRQEYEEIKAEPQTPEQRANRAVEYARQRNGERLAALLAKLHELGLLTRHEYEEIKAAAGGDGQGSEALLAALMAKLVELGIIGLRERAALEARGDLGKTLQGLIDMLRDLEVFTRAEYQELS